ncbi:hypothetical protein JM79_2199 [Gramella sp. Hel_I_59]|uniref:alpha/beta hydrolase family protein n=1 Tax=Gramella sp. Hel_I_59 TaxID=1249978 RepID=UPI00114FDA64|nr:alpha/beta hydrolase [Gramella sp. Hel_I_59]TQI71271.1 hypothetical protein JM79_2199 [Gramella sp. Hel_I_59]
MKNFYILFSLLLTINFIQAQDITGDWYGNLNIQGTELPLVFHLQKNDSTYLSTMDSPKQGGFDIKVDETKYEDSILEMKISALGVKYDGVYDKNDEIINGTFKQGGMSLTLNLTREKPIKKIIRPQEPQKPYPYNSEDISFYNEIDKIKLAGTLTIPKNKKDFPTVILISGSGPQNRNEEIMDHKPFLILSDYLTRNGIGVLRYDDRGVGESEGEYSEATSKDLSRDTKAAIKYLHSRKEINKNKIGLIGHSEGGSIAPMIASKTKDVSFIVLLAGPGLSGKQLLLLQKKLIEEKSGINEDAVNQSQEIFKGAYNIISNFKGNDEQLKNDLKEYFNERFNNSMGESQLNNLIVNLTSPWMKYFIKYDPSLPLKKIDIPVLALFGENDLQVPALKNSKVFQDIGNKNIDIIKLDNLNHLFQESKTGLPNEYSEIEQTISPKVLNIISDWIIEHN